MDIYIYTHISIHVCVSVGCIYGRLHILNFARVPRIAGLYAPFNASPFWVPWQRSERSKVQEGLGGWVL